MQRWQCPIYNGNFKDIRYINANNSENYLFINCAYSTTGTCAFSLQENKLALSGINTLKNDNVFKIIDQIMVSMV